MKVYKLIRIKIIKKLAHKILKNIMKNIKKIKIWKIIKKKKN
jgi:hypothetical protein